MIGAAALVLLALASAVVFALAMRGRRIDDAPLCRRCRFDLSGIEIGEGARCPECGRPLSEPGGVRFGRRRRMKRTAAIAGVACVLLGAGGAAIGWGRARGFNWHSIHPLWLLRIEVRSDSSPIRTPALAELARRFEGDPRYERAALDELVEEALARQADRSKTWIPEWGDLVEIAWLRGDLSKEQKRRYIEGNIEIEMKTRASINNGDTLPLDYLPRYRLARKPRIELTIEFERVWQWPDDHDRNGERYRFGSAGGLIRAGGGLLTSTSLCLPVGPHELAQCWRISVYEGRWRMRNSRGSLVGKPEDALIAQWLEMAQAKFEVRPPERPAIVTHTDPLVGGEIARALRIRITEAAGSTSRLAIDLAVQPCEYSFSATAMALARDKCWAHMGDVRSESRTREWRIDDWTSGPKTLTIGLACDGWQTRQSSLTASETWSGILMLEDIPIDGQWHEPRCVSVLPLTTENHRGFEAQRWSALQRQLGRPAK